MDQRRFNSMGLAEATAHLAALTALSWLLQHIRAREALAVVDDRLAAGGGASRVAARSVMRLSREAGRLGLETAAAGPEDAR